MSIIDKICEVEERINQFRSSGEQDLLEIKEDIKTKKEKMRQQLLQELELEKETLQKEMLMRVEEYKLSLSHKQNSTDFLREKFIQQKPAILEYICKYFWKE